jgi:hypothetical protein
MRAVMGIAVLLASVVVAVAPSSSSSGACPSAGSVAAGLVRLCQPKPNSGGHGRFVVVARDGSRSTLSVRAPGSVGHWAWAAASPDGRTLLAQWSAECEVPVAYFVPAGGGRPVALARSGVSSTAYGWTTDRRAIVFFPTEPGCGKGDGAGTYFVSRSRARKLVARSTAAPDLPRSIRARSAASIRRRLAP